jgi:hypothetical protein
MAGLKAGLMVDCSARKTVVRTVEQTVAMMVEMMAILKAGSMERSTVAHLVPKLAVHLVDRLASLRADLTGPRRADLRAAQKVLCWAAWKESPTVAQLDLRRASTLAVHLEMTMVDPMDDSMAGSLVFY